MLRSDTAGYQHELLQYCAEGKDQRFGVIEFAVGVDVTPEFKQAVAAVPEGEWHPLERVLDGGERVPTGQEWAEVCFVPEWVSRSKTWAGLPISGDTGTAVRSRLPHSVHCSNACRNSSVPANTASEDENYDGINPR